MESNDELVDYLVEKGYIESDKVEKAFRNVDRSEFMPESEEHLSYVDTPIGIAENATISAPHMVAINTELIEPESSDRVAEIGSGSGYQAAILAELVDEVVGIEVIEELVENSRRRLSGRENVDIVEGDGLQPVEGKFDKILYSCAVDSFAEAKERLAENGIVVAPIYTDSTQELRKLKEGEIEQHGRVNFVPRVELHVET